MTSNYSLPLPGMDTEENITTRRSAGDKKSKMALSKRLTDLENSGSLFIDSILSQDEKSEVISMFDMADELKGVSGLPTLYTSTQMIRAVRESRSRSPALSPIRSAWCPSDQGRDSTRLDNPVISTDIMDYEQLRNNHNSSVSRNLGPLINSKVMGFSEESNDERIGISFGDARHVVKVVSSGSDAVNGVCNGAGDRNADDPVNLKVNDRCDKHDLVSSADEEKGKDEEGSPNRGGPNELNELNDTGEVSENEGVTVEDKGEQEGSGGDLCGDGEAGESGDDGGDGGGGGDGGDGSEVGSDSGSNEVPGSDSQVRKEDLTTQMSTMNKLLERLDSRSININTHVKSLETSLEYSQSEIDTLKKENAELKERLGAMDTEEKRTQFQIKAVDDRVEKLETVTKKKNLLFEGVPELEGRKEDVQETICEVLDQMGINKPINLSSRPLQ